MNMKQRVISYLDKHPNATTNDLRSEFPDANKKSLWNYSGQWKKKKGIKTIESSESIRHKVFTFLGRNPGAKLSDLRRAFPDANKVSISNYRYQWKKQQTDQGRNISVKDKVFSYIQDHPDASYGQLRKALPNINPSSVSAYHSLWKKMRKENQPIKTSTKTSAAMPRKKNKTRNESSFQAPDQQLIRALYDTIEAQKGTIEAMKTQNAMLKEKQASIFNEVENMSKNDLEEIKKIMSTYIKGMRKL